LARLTARTVLAEYRSAILPCIVNFEGFPLQQLGKTVLQNYLILGSAVAKISAKIVDW
jgi:hypothetical protein